jgi:nucleoside-diphosphate-sugar epimerase
VLNRGRNAARPLPPGVNVLRADIREPDSVRHVINDLEFDAVVDWVAFTAGHVHADVDLFRGRTRQYVFISSASAYQTPPARVPVTESTPLRNPYWRYSRDKIACEDLLVAAYRDEGFPATIIRPSHTYDQTLVPFDGGWTVLGRMLAGKPVIVHGDGTSLWTLTHHDDFARAFVPLLGDPRTIGEAIHITSDDVLTWNQIAEAFAAALGVTARLVHVPSDAIAAADPVWGAGLLGDKAHSMVFDNAKLRSLVPGWRAAIPFERGAREIVEWYLADPARQVTDASLDATMDKLAAAWAI